MNVDGRIFETAEVLHDAPDRRGDAWRAAARRTTRSPRPRRRTWPRALPRPSIAETKAIAEEGFIYGLPIVMNYAVMNEFAVDKNSGQFKAPFNQINNEARVFTYKDTAVVTPNSDTPYSMLWLDLRAEPMVISVPAVEKERYYSVQLIDGNTYNYGYIGSRATGNEAGRLHGGRPRLEGRDARRASRRSSTRPRRSRSPSSAPSSSTPADMPNVMKVQAGYKVQPLSAFLKQPAPPAAPEIDFLPATTAGIKDELLRVSRRRAAVRARRRRRTRRSAPSWPASASGRARPSTSRISRWSTRPPSCWRMKEGDDKVDKYLASGMKDINGWKVGSLFGDRAFYNGDWLKRAAAAKGGIYGNDAVEAMYPMTRVDATGETLDGSKHNYTLTFPAGQLPPVNAFWSVTMYDGKTQLLIENPINRYLINSPMLPGMKKNARRLADALHPEGLAGQGEGSQLAARAERHRSTWSCASTGRRTRRPRSCRPAKAPGSRRPSWRRNSGRSRTDRRDRQRVLKVRALSTGRKSRTGSHGIAGTWTVGRSR